MHAQERDYYAPSLAYFHRLETDPLLAQWRRGAVRWFSKVRAVMMCVSRGGPVHSNFRTPAYPLTHPSPMDPPTQVVEHLHANREAIATATNFLDRHFGR